MLIHSDTIYFGFCLRAATQLQLTKRKVQRSNHDLEYPKDASVYRRARVGFLFMPVGECREG